MPQAWRLACQPDFSLRSSCALLILRALMSALGPFVASDSFYTMGGKGQTPGASAVLSNGYIFFALGTRRTASGTSASL